MSKKPLVIVLGATSNVAFAAGNVILGINKNAPNLDADFILYNDNNLSQNDKDVFEKLNCKLVAYNFPLKDNRNFNKESMKQFTFMMFARYECFELLQDYKTVVWIDIDTLVQDDINKLIDNCKKSVAMWQTNESIKVNFTKLPTNYKMNINSYNSGVLVLKDSLEEPLLLKEWCYKKTNEMADILFCPDQGILNLMLQEFNLDITNLDEKFNCHPVLDIAKDAVILHSYRPEKIWNFWKNKDWSVNHKKWLELGGSNVKIKTAPLLSRLVLAKYPDSPNPVRKPRQFVMYLYNKYFSKR